MPDTPEPKSTTEPLDLRRKTEAIVTGQRPVDGSYPYIGPDYQIPFLHLGTEKQLFVDNFILDHLDGVERVFPTPDRPTEAVFRVGDLPWETQRNPFPAAALHDPDDGKFKFWYVQPQDDNAYGDHGQTLCYAESTDCLHWEKPLSQACIPYNEYAETNIVLLDSGHHIGLVLNHDQSDPSRKFLMVYNPHDRARSQGKRTMSTVLASPDGLSWTTVSEDTPYRHHHFQRIIWDPAIQKWIAYSQYSHHWNPLYRKRQIGRQESDDFIHWSPKQVVLSADWDPNVSPDVEFHDLSIRKEGDLYIGIVTEFVAEPLWNVRNDVAWRDVAHARPALYVSRDGLRWERVGGPGPWVDNRGPGSIDYGFVAPTVAGQLVHNGKIHILYNAIADKQHWFKGPPPTPIVPQAAYEAARREWESLGQTLGEYPRHERCVNALILREDGWAVLRPRYEHGAVVTKQFVFEGDTLRVNADVYGGYLQVAVLDPSFNPYPGFGAADCSPVTTTQRDQVWHTVRWGDADLRTLWNKPVRLVFHLHQASLYAFHIPS